MRYFVVRYLDGEIEIRTMDPEDIWSTSNREGWTDQDVRRGRGRIKGEFSSLEEAEELKKKLQG